MALYLEHFGLHEPPFRITPHTDFFFDGADRGATLEALLYAVVHDEGIVKVAGEVGSGKTMLSRVLMERLPPQVDTIYLATASFERDEILHAIGEELDLKLDEARRSAALRALHERLIGLYAKGRRVVVLIDEAHVMPDETLEQVRLLSNLESNRHKLLQIVLFGQPELDDTLAKPGLRQLRDRVTHAFRMRPLPAYEVARYLSFRMRAAGYRGPEVFAPRAVINLARASAGLTRRINILADKALLAAFTDNTHGVTEKHVRAAIADSEFAALSSARRSRGPLYAGLALAAGLALGLGLSPLLSRLVHEPDPPAQPVAAQAQVARAAPVEVKPAAEPVAHPAAVQPRSEPPTVQPAAEPAPPLLAEAQVRRLKAYAAPNQQLLGERLTATRNVLEKAADERYSIELYWTDNTDPARMERFLVRAREWVPLNELFIIPVAGQGKLRLQVVLGEFDSREAALEAARRLPPRYQQAFRTFPRSFGELRSQL
ncbi:MAG: ExeA family protein [Betaproteobacteria bacterium]